MNMYYTLAIDIVQGTFSWTLVKGQAECSDWREGGVSSYGKAEPDHLYVAWLLLCTTAQCVLMCSPYLPPKSSKWALKDKVWGTRLGTSWACDCITLKDMALQVWPYDEISEFSPDLEETGGSQDTHMGQTGISNIDIEKSW